jgi:hypothetical protein
MAQRRITVRSGGWSSTFEGDPQLHTIEGIGIHYITLSDPSEPSGRRVVWQQRVENGVAEGFEITAEGFESPES